ncbi:Clp1/GlmU family protein [Sphingosinicella sp. BN140058]|uniref:Clp1/GlmU family protein n=1 Tax=Sphingosinicella sp. BN140058 TaxID=1892855 RepID=UPI0010100E3E|nr:Clp1/GlmU family protein [Sphingosinicella sp. BN140058]QAY76911.1 hypothetical protein ETR14_10695 [Sphingosinicella sp. BN140058]
MIGPTDAGKSSFIRMLAWQRRFALLDLDPGQKMVGPPGTVSRGRFVGEQPVCDRFAFIGSTNALAIARIVGAAAKLSETAPFVVNTSGFVSGPGGRLQAASIAAVDADIVVAIGMETPPVPRSWSRPIIVLPRSPFARRKSAARRRHLREQALDRSLGLETIALSGVTFEPALPVDFTGADRPVCALADASGEDMAIAILCAADPQRVLVCCKAPPQRVATVRLGHLWASPTRSGWRLRERLEPAWRG